MCRILDYGQYKYELQKREREAKKKQKSQTFKEIRLRVKIDVNDLRTKLRRAGQFLDEGDRVKVTVQFRGREMSHANLGRDLLDRAAGVLAEHGTVERPPLLEGRNMYIVMAPLEKRAEKKTDDVAGERPASAARRPSPPNRRMPRPAAARSAMRWPPRVPRRPRQRADRHGGAASRRRDAAVSQDNDAEDQDPQGNGQALQEDGLRQVGPAEGVARPSPEIKSSRRTPLRGQAIVAKTHRKQLERLLPYE